MGNIKSKISSTLFSNTSNEKYPKRGIFVLFEGFDKSGKTTQARILTENLKLSGLKSVLYTFPNRYTEIGKIIDKYLKKEIHLSPESVSMLFTANRWELMHDMVSNLKAGCNIIVDRYIFSGIAYSGCDREWACRVEENLLCPDIVFLMQDNHGLPCQSEEEVYENDDKRLIVCKNFDGLMKYTENETEWVPIKSIGAESIFTISDEILSKVNDKRKECKYDPIYYF